VLQLSLASKLGFHPLTKAVLVAISTSPPKWLHTRSIAIEDSGNVGYAFCEVIWLSLALKLGLPPVAIAHLSPGTSS
jgi:hypothetical protein